jgi:hypothetical protein
MLLLLLPLSALVIESLLARSFDTVVYAIDYLLLCDMGCKEQKIHFLFELHGPAWLIG